MSAPKDTIKTLRRDVWMFLTKIDTPYSNGIVTSDTPCRYYAQGRCNRPKCQFSHEKQQKQTQRKFVPECTRGQQCQFFAWGTCHYFHRGFGVQQPKNQQNTQNTNDTQNTNNTQNTQNTQKKCHFQDRCWNQNCKFNHEDFSMGTQFQENY